MKTISEKHGAKTIIKIVPDNYVEPEYDLEQNDISTSLRKGLGFSDISKEKWEKIFGKNRQQRDI